MGLLSTARKKLSRVLGFDRAQKDDSEMNDATAPAPDASASAPAEQTPATIDRSQSAPAEAPAAPATIDRSQSAPAATTEAPAAPAATATIDRSQSAPAATTAEGGADPAATGEGYRARAQRIVAKHQANRAAVATLGQQVTTLQGQLAQGGDPVMAATVQDLQNQLTEANNNLAARQQEYEELAEAFRIIEEGTAD